MGNRLALAPLVMAARRPLLCLRLYVSEGRSAALLQHLRLLAAPWLRDMVVDAAYNRSSMTLVSPYASNLVAAVARVVTAARASIDMAAHVATHPRLGVVDHISVHDLTEVLAGTSTVGPDSTEASVELAHGLAATVAQCGVDAYVYGAAHPQGRPLKELRRALGYFRPQAPAAAEWRGLPLAGSCLAVPPPDYPAVPLPREPCDPSDGLGTVGPNSGAAPAPAGICCVGAVRWVVNFNVPLRPGAGQAEAEALARQARVPHRVESMALRHGDHWEVAMNLLTADVFGVEDMHERLSVSAVAVAVAVAGGGGGQCRHWQQHRALLMGTQLLALGGLAGISAGGLPGPGLCGGPWAAGVPATGMSRPPLSESLAPVAPLRICVWVCLRSGGGNGEHDEDEGASAAAGCHYR
jgi:hypothetical protein